jgi:chromosomal replication initiation ATPase DnaA
LRTGLVKKNLRLSGRRIDIKTLAQKVSERYNVSMGELRSGGRRSAVVKARHSMSWIGVRKVGYSGADLARGITVTLIDRKQTGKNIIIG